MTIPLVCEKEQATTKTNAGFFAALRMTNVFLWFAKEFYGSQKETSKGQRQVRFGGGARVEVEKRISPLRRSQKRDRLRSK